MKKALLFAVLLSTLTACTAGMSTTVVQLSSTYDAQQAEKC